MAELDLIKVDPRALLDQFKKAYYNDTGTTLQIGSDEYAAASVFAYCWSVLLSDINNATLNRFIDSSKGMFLDAIAANYGIDERPKGYHATATFSLTTTANPITIPANALIVEDNAGNQFTNRYDMTVDSSVTQPNVLYAVNAGTEYNGIPQGEITNIVEGSAYITACSNQTMTAGGTDGFEDDDVYREWLKIQIQSFAGAGTYAAYQARAKNADSRILDVYVLRQDDSGYQKGKVQIFILTDTATDLNNQVLDIVQNTCSDIAFRPIGDLVEVYYSTLQSVDIDHYFRVSYPERFRGIAVARNSRIMAEYNALLQSEINRPFKFVELCEMLCTKDDDGVYATDAKPIGITTVEYYTPIYPDKGSRLSVSVKAFLNSYDTEGA